MTVSALSVHPELTEWTIGSDGSVEATDGATKEHRKMKRRISVKEQLLGRQSHTIDQSLRDN
jgi:hypothetical protein